MNKRMRPTCLAAALLFSCNGSKGTDSSTDTGTAGSFACDNPNSPSCTITLSVTEEDFPFDRYASKNYSFASCENLEKVDNKLLLLAGATANKFKSTLEGASGDAQTGLEAWYDEFAQLCTDSYTVATKRRTGPTGDIPVECVDQLSFTTNSANNATAIFNITMQQQGSGATEAIINQAQALRVEHWLDTLNQAPDGCWMVFEPAQAKHNQQLWLAAIYGMHHFKAPAYMRYTDPCGTDVEVLVQRLRLEVSSSDPGDIQLFLDFMNDPTLNTTINQLTVYITEVDYVDASGNPMNFAVGDPGPAGCSKAPWELGGAPLGIIDPNDSSQLIHIDELAAGVRDLTIITPQ